MTQSQKSDDDQKNYDNESAFKGFSFDPQFSGKVMDDFARMATGAFSAFQGFRTHIKDEVRSHINKFVAEMDFVPRDEFEIIEEMAKKARLENQKLAKRLDALEGKEPKKKAVAKPKKTTATKKTKKK